MWVTCETKQTPDRYTSCGSGVCSVSEVARIFQKIINNATSPIFFNIAIFGRSTASTGTKSSCGPQVFYMNSTVLSRRTRMTCQKNSQPQTL